MVKWLQAEDRAHRIGQKKEVLVLVLVSSGTIEQVILDRAQQKKEIDAKVIQVGHAHVCHIPLYSWPCMQHNAGTQHYIVVVCTPRVRRPCILQKLTAALRNSCVAQEGTENRACM